MGQDTITLGDLKINNQVIGVATEVEIPLLDEVVWDGILGLAYPNNNMKKKQIKPLFDNIISQQLLGKKGEKNQFSYYLGPDKGAIVFGGVDVRFKNSLSDEFFWTPIAEESYWTISLLDVRKDYSKSVKNSENEKGITLDFKEKRNDVACPHLCKSVMDTGTYLIYGPPELVEVMSVYNKMYRDLEKYWRALYR